MAISNKDSERKEAATVAITEKDQDIVVNWNESLEDEIWQKIVATLAARGYPPARYPNSFNRVEQGHKAQRTHV
jgi:hypothetical protein